MMKKQNFANYLRNVIHQKGNLFKPTGTFQLQNGIVLQNQIVTSKENARFAAYIFIEYSFSLFFVGLVLLYSVHSPSICFNKSYVIDLIETSSNKLLRSQQGSIYKLLELELYFLIIPRATFLIFTKKLIVSNIAQKCANQILLTVTGFHIVMVFAYF